MADRIEVITVERSLPSERLDIWLRSQFPAVSRGAIQRLIEGGHVTVNGQPSKATHAPKAGERIEVRWPEAKPAEAKPEDIPLNILYEDEVLLVMNKPPGLVVHPAAGNEEHTLVNALLHHCKGQLSGIGGVARPGIVHRLDKDTSGCLVAAKNDEAHLALSSQFASRKVSKTYQAIVCGELSRDQGEIKAAIARHSTQRKRMAVNEQTGRGARTTFKVLERLRASTHVEAVIHTGRTHQIRVHFQHLGHPLVGDHTYGNRQNLRLTDLVGYEAPRQMLHAARLSFIHPRTGKVLALEAPLPADFLDALAALRGLPL
jgi:23S rRNA pseudouridine1911/1915/1917 synthase